MMDKHTFGKSQAAINLVKTLEENDCEGCIINVCNLLGKYQQTIKSLLDIKDKNVRETCLKLWRSRFLDHVDNLDMDDTVRSHVKNVVVGTYRKLLKTSKSM